MNPLEPTSDTILDYYILRSIVRRKLFEFCDAKYQVPFDSFSQCEESISTLSDSSELNQYGVHSFTGNNTGCCYVHQRMAKISL